MSLESKRRITAWVEGYGNIPDAFATRTGGNADSEEAKHRAAGGEKEKALGGLQTVENPTISRKFVPERDGPLVRALRPLRGRRQMSITDQPLDRDDNAVGQPDVYTGVFKAVNPSDADANSSDVAMFELELSTDSDIG
jgi:hypothetical protein